MGTKLVLSLVFVVFNWFPVDASSAICLRSSVRVSRCFSSVREAAKSFLCTETSPGCHSNAILTQAAVVSVWRSPSTRRANFGTVFRHLRNALPSREQSAERSEVIRVGLIGADGSSCGDFCVIGLHQLASAREGRTRRAGASPPRPPHVLKTRRCPMAANRP